MDRPQDPAGSTPLLQPILLPSVGPCAAFAAMHQLNTSHGDARDVTTSMALSNVFMGVSAPDQYATGSGTGTEGSRLGVVMNLAVARSGAVTAECSGQQTVSCQAVRLMVPEPSAPFSRGPLSRRSHSSLAQVASIAAVMVSQMLTGQRCIAADGSDASGLGQVMRGGDAEAYAMDPIDMEASAQLASGGPDILLAAASGIRAQKIAAGQCSWMAGCAHPLGPAEVSLIFATWAFSKFLMLDQRLPAFSAPICHEQYT